MNATIILFGDSISDQHDTGDASFGSCTSAPSATFAGSYSKGMLNQFLIRANQPLDIISNQGISGQTSTGILSRINDVIALNPGYVFLQMGVNDFVAGILAPTTLSNFKTAIQTLQKSNICPIVTTLMPLGGTALAMVNAASINEGLKDMAASLDFILIDLYPYNADLTTFNNSIFAQPLTTNFDGSLIHPNAVGGWINGATAIFNSLNSQIKKLSRRSFMNSDGSSNGDLNIINGNPLMLQGSGGSHGTGASGTFSQMYYVQRDTGTISAVGSVITRSSIASSFPGLFDDGIPGYLQELVLSGATASADQISQSWTPASLPKENSGPWIAECEIGALMSSGVLNDCYLQVAISASPNNFNVQSNTNSTGTDYLNLTSFQGVLRTRKFYIPPGISSMYCALSLRTSPGAVGSAYIGNWQMRVMT